MKLRWAWMGGTALAALTLGTHVPGTAGATEPCWGTVHERRYLEVLSVEIDGVATGEAATSELSLTILKSGELQVKVLDPDTGQPREVRGAH